MAVGGRLPAAASDSPGRLVALACQRGGGDAMRRRTAGGWLAGRPWAGILRCLSGAASAWVAWRTHARSSGERRVGGTCTQAQRHVDSQGVNSRGGRDLYVHVMCQLSQARYTDDGTI